METAAPLLATDVMPNAFDFSASPFDCLDPVEQRMVRDNVDIAYFREQDTLLEPAIPPSHLFVIIKGHVAQFEGDEAVASYGPNDCFDGRSLVAGRASSRFVAAEEVVAYQLARETVNELISRNATFGALLFSDLSNKLGALAQRHSQREMQAITMSRVEEAFLRPAAVVDGATGIVAVAQLMQSTHSSGVLVRDGERLGIFTNTGLQRAVADGRPLVERPVRELATFSLVRIAPTKMLLETNVRERQIGKVYCVMPGKGASGATTIACSLAYQFNRINGKESKTLLADFDPSTGMLAFNLKLRPTFSFLEALSHVNSLDESIWKGLVTTVNGLDLVLAPDTPQNGAVQHANPAPIIDYARDYYKTIVVDAQSPYGHWGLGLARSCDELLMVTTNELPTLHATQRALAHLEHNAVDRSKIRLIVNRYNPEAGLGREAIETALKLDVFEMLPDDTDAVTKALLDGKPMLGNTSLGKGIAQMAQKLAGTSGAAAKSKSLFGNLFNLFGN